MNSMLSIVFSGFLTFFGTSTSITSSICSPLVQPAITAPASGDVITQNIVQVQGTASQGSTVAIAVNGTPRVSVMADQAGSFGSSLSLANGNYTISVTASSPCESIGGNQVSVTVNAPVPPTPVDPGTPPATQPSPPATPPSRQPSRSTGAPAASEYQTVVEESGHTITIDGLTDRNTMTVTGSNIRISGYLSSSGLVRIYVNDELVASNSVEGVYFGFDVPLNIGSNKIEVVADFNNDKVRKEFTVQRRSDSQSPSSQSQDQPMTGDMEESSNIGWLLWAGVGALLALILGFSWWIVAARRRRKKDQSNNIGRW